MRRVIVLLGVMMAASGCQTVLRFSRPAPPEGDFSAVRTVSLTVVRAAGQQAENAVMNGLFRGEIPVPINAEELVRERFEARLAKLGYGVCPTAPCGDGVLTVTLTESGVGTELTSSGPVSNARLRVRVVLRTNDGREPYDWSFWDTQSGNPAMAPALVRQTADNVTNRFERTLTPGRAWAELPLEDGGELDMGVNMLLSSQWRGAIDYFNQLVAKQPENDGAWYDLGVAWEAEGDWGQALIAYQRAAALKRKGNYLDAVATAQRMAPALPQPLPTPVQPIPADPAAPAPTAPPSAP